MAAQDQGREQQVHARIVHHAHNVAGAEQNDAGGQIGALVHARGAGAQAQGCPEIEQGGHGRGREMEHGAVGAQPLVQPAQEQEIQGRFVRVHLAVHFQNQPFALIQQAMKSGGVTNLVREPQPARVQGEDRLQDQHDGQGNQGKHGQGVVQA